MDEKEKVFRERVAAKLRDIRGEMSQDDFAAKCGLSQTTVSQYEAGRSLPGLDSLVKIQRATGIDLGDFARLVGGIETKEDEHG